MRLTRNFTVPHPKRRRAPEYKYGIRAVFSHVIADQFRCTYYFQHRSGSRARRARSSSHRPATPDCDPGPARVSAPPRGPPDDIHVRPSSSADGRHGEPSATGAPTVQKSPFGKPPRLADDHNKDFAPGRASSVVPSLAAMSVVKGCVAILSLGLLCLVGETTSSVCCSLPTQVQVPCDRSTTIPTPSAEDTRSSEVASDPPAVPVSNPDEQSDGSDDITELIADQDQGSIHACYEHYCGTVQVEAADTYCSYEQCDSAGCHCTADCIDGSYRAPKWTR